MEELTELLDSLAEALLAYMPDTALAIWRAQRRSVRFWNNTLWDISHFCEELARQGAEGMVHRAAQAVRRALEPSAGRFVVAKSHHGHKVARCRGVTIYLLPPLMPLSRYHGDLDYAQEHRRPEMLQAYHAA